MTISKDRLVQAMKDLENTKKELENRLDEINPLLEALGDVLGKAPGPEYLLSPLMKVYSEVLTEEERTELKEMSHLSFLQTRYWHTVASVVKERDGWKCQLCCSGEPLQVHHNNYEHRGQEHLYLGDLITLCADCHSRHHDKD